MEIGFAMPVGSGIEAKVRLDFAQELERLGYDSFWYPHYVSRDAHGFDTLDMLAAVAAVTQRIKLGTDILQVPLYHPVDLARRVVTLDHLSHGRFLFGVGIGWIPKEFENCGVPFEERAGRTNEALVILKRLWTEEEVTYKGRYYSLREVVLEPKPVQKPYPKTLVGGVYHRERRGAPGARPYPEWSQPAVERVAQFGDGWIPGGSVLVPEAGSEVLVEGMERIRRAAADLGRTITDENFEVSLTSYGEIHIDPDRRRAEEEAARFYARRERRGFYQVQGNPSFEALKETGRFGPAEEVARVIQRWLDFRRSVSALKRLIIMFASVDPLEQLHRFHAHVAPLLRR
jgi:probable F420-dependent oxidoreductase